MAVEARNASEVPLRVQLCAEKTCMGQRVLEAHENTGYGGDKARPAPCRARVPSASGRPTVSWTGNFVEFNPGDQRQVVFSIF